MIPITLPRHTIFRYRSLVVFETINDFSVYDFLYGLDLLHMVKTWPDPRTLRI